MCEWPWVQEPRLTPGSVTGSEAMRCRDAWNIDDGPHAEFNTPALKLECPAVLGCRARWQLRLGKSALIQYLELGTFKPILDQVEAEIMSVDTSTAQFVALLMLTAFHQLTDTTPMRIGIKN